jgi:membrane protease YdiL (CAAX protease family)
VAGPAPWSPAAAWAGVAVLAAGGAWAARRWSAPSDGPGGGGRRLDPGPSRWWRHGGTWAWGAFGAIGLILGPLIGRLSYPPAPHGGAVVLWATTVTAVVLAEEILLRAALWKAVTEAHGPRAALVVSTVAFALMHVPMYGWHVLPLDLAVGAWLGGLRLVSGSVIAPTVAHLVADWAAW